MTWRYSSSASKRIIKPLEFLDSLTEQLNTDIEIILLRLYKSLVRPHLEYSISAWSPHYYKDKVLIERIQRRFTKMIPSIRDLPYELWSDIKLGLWSLEDRRVRADFTEVYKIVHGLSSVKFDTFFDFHLVAKPDDIRWGWSWTRTE